jgi:hypothetical protein
MIARYNKTDLKGVMAGVCPHYVVLMLLQASNPENHAHYLQILSSLKDRFGLERASADIACRMVKMLEALNADQHFRIDLPTVFQSYLHGSFHEWVCLVIRGFSWNPELGRFTGEEAERFFGTSIKLLASLSQQSRLRRAYTLHRFITSWNLWKTRRISKATLPRF